MSNKLRKGSPEKSMSAKQITAYFARRNSGQDIPIRQAILQDLNAGDPSKIKRGFNALQLARSNLSSRELPASISWGVDQSFSMHVNPEGNEKRAIDKAIGKLSGDVPYLETILLRSFVSESCREGGGSRFTYPGKCVLDAISGRVNELRSQEALVAVARYSKVATDRAEAVKMLPKKVLRKLCSSSNRLYPDVVMLVMDRFPKDKRLVFDCAVCWKSSIAVIDKALQLFEGDKKFLEKLACRGIVEATETLQHDLAALKRISLTTYTRSGFGRCNTAKLRAIKLLLENGGIPELHFLIENNRSIGWQSLSPRKSGREALNGMDALELRFESLNDLKSLVFILAFSKCEDLKVSTQEKLAETKPLDTPGALCFLINEYGISSHIGSEALRVLEDMATEGNLTDKKGLSHVLRYGRPMTSELAGELLDKLCTPIERSLIGAYIFFARLLNPADSVFQD